jgi:hypothetical protein
MIQELKKRAFRRKVVAHLLLVLSILIVIFSIILVIMQLQDLNNQHETDFLNIVARLSFIALVTYISQILQRLYRYNILKADYFLSYADALKISSSFSSEEIQKFINVFSSLNNVNVTLNVTDVPNLPFLKPTKDDESKDIAG